MIRFVFQWDPDNPRRCPDGFYVFNEHPEAFVEEWRAWLWEQYGTW